MKIRVVGAGVVGLTTAVELRRAGYTVEIVAERIGTETASRIAAAVWHIFLVDVDERVRRWARETLKRLTALAGGAPDAGVILRRGVEYVRDPRIVKAGVPDWADLVSQFRWLEMDGLPEGVLAAYEVEVPLADMSRYLPWLLGVARSEGVSLQRSGKLASLGEAAEGCDVLINCAGLGARELVNDGAVFPTWGQVVYVSKPETIEDYLGDDDHPDGMTYVLPRLADMVLGGTAVPDVDGIEPSSAETEAILARCARLVPEVAQCEVLEVAAGARPCRHGGIRLERDSDQSLPCTVIHNYGHGGSGFSLAYGCAVEVRDLVAEAR